MSEGTEHVGAEAKVDDSSMSPIERQKSLEKHLQHRPDVQDLKNRHILLDTNAAPALQAAQLELERQKASDNLKKQLEKRADRDDLVGRNILSDSTAAPSLQANQRALERHMRADSLEQKIQHRPTADKLVADGILEADESPLKD